MSQKRKERDSKRISPFSLKTNFQSNTVGASIARTRATDSRPYTHYFILIQNMISRLPSSTLSTVGRADSARRLLDFPYGGQGSDRPTVFIFHHFP